MSGGGKNQRQTTTANSTQTSAAPDYAAPYLADVAQRANQVYMRSGDYTGAMSPDTTNALDMARRLATSGNPLAPAANASALNTINSGGLNNAQRDVLGNLRNEYGALSGPSLAQSNLSGYANGSMLGGNPYLDKILETTNAGIANRVNGAFGAAGRSFSPSHAAAVAKNIAASDNQARFTDYNQQVQNQFQANQLIDAANNARVGMRTGILGQQFGGEQQGVNNVNTAIGQMPGLDAARYADANALKNIGSTIEQNQALQANLPWQQLQNYVSTVRNAAGNYGTQTGNSTSETVRPGPSGLQQALGAGLAIAGLASGNPMMAMQGGSSAMGGGKGGKGGAGATSGGQYDVLNGVTGGGYGGGGIGSR